ncbi:MAG TPA: type II toxin-antitoxin system death-on-curing family toxin [Candidatus Saccharimonadales bacterium]|nr:type II toxin-antitoxin system death-on-curing family toxin [Candidatus Saccharimonadales bacterium]
MNSDSEPIPPFNTRYPGKLESSLAQPFQTFDGKFLYRTFAEKAAVLFYLITKNHCFTNGNKRMAVTLTTLFFFVNKRWIDVTPLGLYEIARVVAESRPEQRDTVHTILLVFFRDHQVALN